MKIGIIAAMDEEIEALLKQLPKHQKVNAIICDVYEASLNAHTLFICKSGVGKVNAALATMQLKMQYDVEYIINIGSAGGLKQGMSVFDVVIADNVGYHDVDVTAFGYDKGQLPQNPTFFVPMIEHIGLFVESLVLNNINYHVGLIVSGDQFIQNENQLNQITTNFADAMCVEMEAAAIAQTCAVLKLPFQIIRAISDVPNEAENEISFNQFLQKAADNSANACLEFLKVI